MLSKFQSRVVRCDSALFGSQDVWHEAGQTAKHAATSSDPRSHSKVLTFSWLKDVAFAKGLQTHLLCGQFQSISPINLMVCSFAFDWPTVSLLSEAHTLDPNEGSLPLPKSPGWQAFWDCLHTILKSCPCVNDARAGLYTSVIYTTIESDLLGFLHTRPKGRCMMWYVWVAVCVSSQYMDAIQLLLKLGRRTAPLQNAVEGFAARLDGGSPWRTIEQCPLPKMLSRCCGCLGSKPLSSGFHHNQNARGECSRQQHIAKLRYSQKVPEKYPSQCNDYRNVSMKRFQLSLI